MKTAEPITGLEPDKTYEAGFVIDADGALQVSHVSEYRRRTWRERLFSLPWRPMQRYQVVRRSPG